MKMNVFLSVLMMILTTCILPAGVNNDENNDQEGKEKDTLKYQVVVTATRTEQPRLELGTSTTLISADEMKKAGKNTVVDALQAVPGLDLIQHGGAGKAAHVFIRGANSGHTLVMIDGVEVNDPMSPGRAYDLGHLSLDNVDRIEVVRGPQSTLYGSDAMGGVINVITKKGAGKPRVSISAEAGSYNTFRESAGLNGGTDAVSYSLEVSRFDTGGYSAAGEKYGNTERDGYANTSFSGRLGFNPSETLDIDLVARYSDGRNDLDAMAGAGGDDPNYIMSSKQLTLAANSRLLLMKGKWEQRLGISYNRINRDLEDGVDELHPMDSAEGLYRGKLFKIDWQHNFYLHPTHTITAGIEFEREEGNSSYSWTGMWGAGSDVFEGESAQTVGFYLQDSIKLKDTFFINLGLRVDDHDRYGTSTTYRVAPALVLKSGTKFKASFGTGFKAPSLYQLFAPGSAWGAVGNENLNPEKSTGWDIGVEQYLFSDDLTFGFTYFENTFEDLIQYEWPMGYVNTDEAESSGVEAFFAARLSDRVRLDGSYTFTDTEDKVTGEQLLRRPRHKANANLNVRVGKDWDAALNLLHLGERADIFPYPTRATAPAYTLLNFSLNYRLNKKVRLFLRIDNLTDQEYENILGYATAGRSAYIGVRYN